jgi:hypothetical protein
LEEKKNCSVFQKRGRFIPIVHPLRIKERVEGGKKKIKPFQRRGRSEEKKKIIHPFQEGRGRSKGKGRKIIVHSFQRKGRLASIYK